MLLSVVKYTLPNMAQPQIEATIKERTNKGAVQRYLTSQSKFNFVIGESSKPKEVVRTVYVESDESKRAKVLSKLENQLEQLKKEVASVEPSIKQDVKQTVSLEQDALLMRYSQLKDKAKIEEDIRNMFGNFPMLNFIVDTASRMVAAMTSSKEMTEILRWHVGARK